MTALTDIVIVGAGPAGIAAAVRAAAAGREVVLIDEAPRVGGQIWRHRSATSLPPAARGWVERLERSAVTVRCATAVVDAWRDGGTFALRTERNGDDGVLRARAVVVATGARERYLPFPGWTLPGVFGIGGAQALLKQGATFAGQRIVIGGTGPLLLPVAAALSRSGARVAIVAEQAPWSAVVRFAASLWRQPATLREAAAYRAGFARTRYATGVWVAAAEAGTNAAEPRVRSVTLTDGRRHWQVRCDVLCTGYGLVPNVELPRLLGCAVERAGTTVDGGQQTTVPGVFAAGETTGVGGAELALVEGEIAGASAAGAAGAGNALLARRRRLLMAASGLDRAFAPRAELLALATPETVVCRCEDVRRAMLAGYASAREAKLATRAGMGACQGRVCAPVLELLFGWSSDTVRPPVQPARLATLLSGVAMDAAPTETRSPTAP